VLIYYQVKDCLELIVIKILNLISSNIYVLDRFRSF